MSGGFGECDIMRCSAGGCVWRTFTSQFVQCCFADGEESESKDDAAVSAVFDGGDAVADDYVGIRIHFKTVCVENEVFEVEKQQALRKRIKFSIERRSTGMKNTLHGYMTLEASLIMPFVWLSLFFVIFAGFFQYDRCIAEQDGKMTVLRATEMREKDEAEVIRTVIEKGELAGKKKLLFSEGVQKDFEFAGDKAKMRISGQIKTILDSLGASGELHIFKYAAEYEAERYDPVRFIRTCRKLI